MDELRDFVARRAEAAGDRDRYLSIQFDQTVDSLTLDKYKAFKKICTRTEWGHYEPKVLQQMKKTWGTEQLKIRMHRREYSEAMDILSKRKYPMSDWYDDYEVRTAKKLEKRFPEEILKYYLSGLGNLKTNATRKEYARKAKVMVNVRRLLVEVMGDQARWVKFASNVKKDNKRRPAFQQEFGKVLPGWQDLK
jgi:hypothetical protein